MLGDVVILLVALNVIAQVRILILCVVMRVARERARVAPDGTGETPAVAIQIAAYREAPALPGLLESILALRWPRDRMRIQILDDSIGADALASQAVVQQMSGCGVSIEYFNRGTRVGFKAGALNYGLKEASDVELIAYFDADCRPRPDFLARIVPRFEDCRVAAVQARWEYPNACLSPLTMAQQAAFEYLFRYEYGVRDLLQTPVFYLGSAAVWRREAMEQLGGWRVSHFTAEDVDMGCRAGNGGWKLLYEPTVLADDDALEEILPYRAQQRRWARAVSQAGLDAAGGFWKAPRSRVAQIVEITGLLTHATIPLTLLTALLIACQILFGTEHGRLVGYSQWAFAVLVVSPPSIWALILANRYFHRRDWIRQARLLAMAGPVAAATMTSFIFGLADLVGAKRAEFIATPKSGQTPVATGSKRRWLSMHYAPLVFDGICAIVLLSAGGVALSRGVRSAAISTAALGAAFAGSFIQSTAATRRHRASLAGSAVPSRT